jgi:outer membrane protein assembly factor BamB
MRPTRALTLPLIAAFGVLLCAASPSGSAPASVSGWLNWRGPQQNGVSQETGLPDAWAPGGANHLWTVDLSGGGTPVIANGKVYAMGYEGQGGDLQEVLWCGDAETGKELWRRRFSDFISDVIYDRYAIGSPTIDPETGNVYAITAPGIFMCFTADGKLQWSHSMMEEFGRLTFPNGRNGAPFIDEDLVIVRGITGNWGADGPGMDRFYAFDKRSGGLVWSSSPGIRPKDNSFAMPVLAWRDGKRVFYTGAGDGNLICVNARTGEPIWAYQISAGGLNASVVLHKGKVIGIHADENLDNSTIGRQVAVRADAQPKPAETGPPVLDRSAEVWRNELEAFSTSPVLVGDRIYQVSKTGFLCCVDANTGKVLWQHRLGPDQLHASPLYADGKLYVPMQSGLFYILRPNDTGVTELSKAQLEGRCVGAPSVWNGKVYVHSTGKLYCFGRKGGSAPPPAAEEPRPRPGKPVALQISPAEVLLRPGERVKFAIRGIDANGLPTGPYDSSRAKWAKYIPPTARVRAEMNAAFTPQGELQAAASAQPSAGAWEADIDGLKGYIRGRVLPGAPLKEDFEGYDLSVAHPTEADVKFAYPPLPWIGARAKWEVRDVGGSKALVKTLDNTFLQRSTVFLGHPDAKSYTLEADVMSDGNRRTMSTVGLINQRYLISLLGNSQELEVSSNLERMKASAPFPWSPKQWYRLKTRVDTAPDGSGVVRVKAWKRGDPEPEKWTLEASHRRAHASGSPGLFGFSPSSLFRVYVDNISMTPNQ